jgi:hypothetical protein
MMEKIKKMEKKQHSKPASAPSPTPELRHNPLELTRFTLEKYPTSEPARSPKLNT